ncbi:DUF167 domain-containing protein [Candidatus Woesearchaeota archaeon]|nr:DUF167 domain-containing protein [Candidatus Woesearchaeota archaeon]
MRLEIKVKTGSGKSEIVRKEEGYVAFLKSPPEHNKANLELIKLAKKQFQSEVRIVSGLKSKTKIIEID